MTNSATAFAFAATSTQLHVVRFHSQLFPSIHWEREGWKVRTVFFVRTAAAGCTHQPSSHKISNSFSGLPIFPIDPLPIAAGCCQSAPPGSLNMGALWHAAQKLPSVRLMRPELRVCPWWMEAEAHWVKARIIKRGKNAAVWLNPRAMRVKGGLCVKGSEQARF